MPKPLVIVESPAKARTIAGFLGSDYEVMASIGHIRDLPKSGLAIDVDNGFRPEYEVPAGKKDVVRKLKAALKNADELILATDEDREGEAISWHIVEVLQPKVPTKRMVFHEITPSAIQEAIDNPRTLDLKLVEAQEGRRVLDRLVGYEVSPVLWRKIGSQARSAGRVQSVAVRMVVERERARMAFRRGGWFDLEATFEALDVAFGASLTELNGVRVASGNDFDPSTGQVAAGREVVLLDEGQAAALVAALRERPFRVRSVESQQFVERPKPPFTTSTLQQEASRKLRFPAAKTMAVAQRLYERGFITYMRTDSTNLSEQAITAARTAIRERFGAEFLPDSPRLYRGKVKNAQEAHEAIRPAGERIRPPEAVAAELDADERRLYELVWNRTVACQMVDARARRVTVRIGAETDAGDNAVFRASGKSYEFLGFRRVYVEDTDDDGGDEREARLPNVADDDPVTCLDLAPAGHETKPPARFTEASLVKELEERGIGRPSTYAAVLGTIQAREYVWKKGTALVPAWSAFAVIRLLEEHFGHLVDYGFTASMEEALDAIAAGQGEAEKWLHSFYFGNGTAGLAELVGDENLAAIDPRAVSTIPLGSTDDGSPVVVRVGRYGPYVQVGDTEERGSIPVDLAPDEITVPLALELIERQKAGPQAIGTDPESGLEVFVLNGRYGPYVQLGEQEEGTKVKPKRASLFASMQPESVTLDDALRLLSLPRVVGADAEGREIVAHPGKFGPYLKRADGETRSLAEEAALFTTTVAEAEFLFSQPKRGRGRVAKPPLAEFGESPDTGKPMRVLEGRFGPYVTDGITNATVPRGTDPTTLSADEALALLRARAQLNETSPRQTRASKASGGAKKTAKKAAKKTTKKAAKKATKSTAKKATKKAAGPGLETTVTRVVKKASKPSTPKMSPTSD